MGTICVSWKISADSSILKYPEKMQNYFPGYHSWFLYYTLPKSDMLNINEDLMNFKLTLPVDITVVLEDCKFHCIVLLFIVFVDIFSSVNYNCGFDTFLAFNFIKEQM